VDKSLVKAEADGSGEELRYIMLEPIRQYGLERLEERGEAETVRRRHAAWCMAFAEGVERELSGPEQSRWLEKLETEHDNLRAALRWTLEGGKAELGLGLAAALWSFWYSRGHLSEGRRWLESAIFEVGPLVTLTKAKALNGAGYITLFQGAYGAAKGFIEEGLKLYRQLGDAEASRPPSSTSVSSRSWASGTSRPFRPCTTRPRAAGQSFKTGVWWPTFSSSPA
jgi:hypothetical protein